MQSCVSFCCLLLQAPTEITQTQMSANGHYTVDGATTLTNSLTNSVRENPPKTKMSYLPSAQLSEERSPSGPVRQSKRWCYWLLLTCHSQQHIPLEKKVTDGKDSWISEFVHCNSHFCICVIQSLIAWYTFDLKYRLRPNDTYTNIAVITLLVFISWVGWRKEISD